MPVNEDARNRLKGSNRNRGHIRNPPDPEERMSGGVYQSIAFGMPCDARHRSTSTDAGLV